MLSHLTGPDNSIMTLKMDKSVEHYNFELLLKFTLKVS